MSNINNPNNRLPSDKLTLPPKPAEQQAARTHAQADHAAALQNSHAAQDYPVMGNVELSDTEYLSRFRSEQSGNILPKPPEIPGYHTCWIPEKSNNAHDNVSTRERLGYSVVKHDELPGFCDTSNRSGQFEGCVSHEELILMKIPMRFYQLLMTDAHYTQPYEQEASIREKIKYQFVDKNGESIIRDADGTVGMNTLARKVKAPIFS